MDHEYLYHFHKLYPLDRSYSDVMDVPKDELICHDVEPQSPSGLAKSIHGEKALAWTFSVGGMEGRFITHYDWALVRKTPENENRLSEIQSLHNKRAALQKLITQAWKSVDTAASDLTSNR